MVPRCRPPGQLKRARRRSHTLATLSCPVRHAAAGCQLGVQNSLEMRHTMPNCCFGLMILLLCLSRAAAQAPVADSQVLEVEAGSGLVVITLRSSLGEEGVYRVTSLPEAGTLSQTLNGYNAVGADEVLQADTVVEFRSAASGGAKLIYVASNSSSDVELSFGFTVENEDGSLVSEEASVVLRIYAAGCTLATLQEWDLLLTPPSPQAQIGYDAERQVFTFNASVAYMREGSAWVVDFSEFQADDVLGSDLGSCENRGAAGSYGERWQSAPSAEFPGALGSNDRFLAYGASGWTLSAQGCNQVGYYREFGFAELLSCTDRASQQPGAVQVEAVAGTPFTRYSGSLWMHVVVANDVEDATAGVARYVWEFPFVFTFDMVSNEVVTVGSEKDLSVRVQELSLDEEGRLVLVLATQTLVDDWLVGPYSVPSTPYALELIEEAAPGNNNQQWRYRSLEVSETNYTGSYSFGWTFASGGPAVATVSLDMVAESVVDEQYALNTIIETFEDFYETESAGPFGNGDRLFVKDSLDVDAADVNNFQITMVNAWLCWSDNPDYEIAYDPEVGKFGCRDPVPGAMAEENILQVIAGGVLQETELALLSPAFYDQEEAGGSVFVHSSHAGFSVDATPLAVATRVYTIHVETLIEQREVGGKRRRMMLRHAVSRRALQPGEEQPTGQGNNYARVYVRGEEAAEAAKPEQTASEQTQAWIAAVAAVGGALVVAGVVVVIVVVVTRRRKEEKEEDVEQGVSPYSTPEGSSDQ